jgi:uncharacterized protein YcbX
MSDLRLSLHVCPVKSCGSLSLGQWDVDDFGLRCDRRRMIVTLDGGFVAQRGQVVA